MHDNQHFDYFRKVIFDYICDLALQLCDFGVLYQTILNTLP